MSKINKTSGLLYRLGRYSRWARAIEQSIKTGSPRPLIRRFWNTLVGRIIVSKLWWRK